MQRVRDPFRVLSVPFGGDVLDGLEPVKRERHDSAGLRHGIPTARMFTTATTAPQ
jgi:hypothetical protein